MKKFELKKIALQKAALVVIVALGVLYLNYTWIRFKNNQADEVLQIAKSIEAALPKENLKKIELDSRNIDKPSYQAIKNTLDAIIRVNTKAKFAYIYTIQNGETHYLVSSKSEYSPSEKEFSVIDRAYNQLFDNKKKYILDYASNRNEKSIGVFIPIKEDTSGKFIAVFAINFNAKAWDSILLFKLIESTTLIVLLLLVSLFLFRIKAKNKALKSDITERKLVENDLRESERKYRSIFENVQDVFYQTDLEGNILEITPSIEHFSGLTIDEIKKIRVDNFYYNPEDRLIMLNSILKNGELRDYELRLRMKTGKIKHVSINARLVFDTNGSPSHIDGALRDITERKQAKANLIESEYRLRTIIETEPECIKIVDAKGRLLLMNPAGLAMIEADSLEQVTGQPVLNVIAPEYQRTFARMHKRVLAGESIRKEFEILGLKGRRLWLETNAVPMLYHGKVVHLAHTRNITERKMAEEKLRESEMFLKETQIIAQLGTYILNIKDGDWTSSDILDTILGINSFDDKSTQSWTSVVHPEWQQMIENYFKNEVLANKCKFDKEYKIIRESDRKERWVHGLGEIIYNELNQPFKMIGTIQDITERKQIEEELIIAKEKAEESDRLKSAFLANMSHEIRTPMNGILGFAELLKEPNLTGEEKIEFIDIIEKSGNRMLNIINDIIDISKIESGLMKVSISETNINKQIEYIYNFFKPEVDSKKIKLTYKTSLPTNEVLIKTDTEKIYAILTNLVKNAIKFTTKGTIEFGYNLKLAKLKTDCNSGYLFESYDLEFFVKDTGTGIPQEHLELIFERFRQSSESLTRNHDGAGLGLAISKAFIESLGGKIWVESELGKGTTFYFTIPYNATDKPKVLVKIPDKLKTKNKQINTLKILIVEDDEISARLLKQTIKEIGKEVLRARTGIEAIEVCHKNPDLDLILMDMQMPKMDGYKTTQEIRKFNKEVVIIAQTAYALTGDREKTINMGCNNYISKPVNKKELMTLLNGYFEQNTQIQNLSLKN